MKIVSVYPSFAEKGGAEDMAISIGNGLNGEKYNIILHLSDHVLEKYRLTNTKFEKFNIKNIIKYHKEGAIFLSHHRKTTTFLLLISRFLCFGKLRVIHVAHNPFSTLKHYSLYPKYNIAVSNAVKQNLISYFGVEDKTINVIYNGIRDHFDKKKLKSPISRETINILYLRRILRLKKQVEFVKHCRGHLAENIRIYFAGVGKDLDNLREVIDNDEHFIMLGLIDTYKDISKFDYVCLFSINEGLPLSLIEGEMFGKPLITNELPQSLEVNKNGFTGRVNYSWNDIVKCINNLPNRDTEYYRFLSQNSRNTFEKLFNYDVMIENYKKYIKSIVWE